MHHGSSGNISRIGQRDLSKSTIFSSEVPFVTEHHKGVNPEDVSAFDYGEYNVDEIINHRRKHGAKGKAWKNFQFLVKWKGYDVGASTWEGYDAVKSTEALELYLQANPRL